MEWIHDEYSVVEKHAQTMLQLVKFGIDWKCGELEQIVNIPVTQIVEEITEVNIPVPQIVEEIAVVSKSSIEWRNIPNLYFCGNQSVSWMSLCETGQLISFCVD